MKKAYIFLLCMAMALCNGFAQDILNEGFEGGSMPPSGWTVSVYSPNTDWHGWERSASTKHSGNYSAMVEFANPNHNSYLITPQLSLSGHKLLSFWVAVDYASYAYGTDLTVEISTSGSSVADFNVLQTITLPDQDYEFVNVVIDLQAYDGQNVYLAFHVYDTYGTSVYLDDIRVYDVPTCYAPTGITVSNISTTSATVSWTGDDNVTAYLVSRTNMGTNPEPSVVDTVTDETCLLTGLQPSSYYNVTIKSICDDQSTSAWSEVASFFTSCPSVTVSETQPWVESFEEVPGTGNMPLNTCWATPQMSANYNSPNCLCDWPAAAHSGGNSVVMRGDNTETNLLVLPAFTNSTNTLRLGFYANTTSGSVANAGYLTVGYVTDENDGDTFVPLFPITPNDSSLGRAYSVYYGPFDLINAPANASRIAIRFVSNAWSISWNLDDITVSIIPECSTPTQLSTIAVTPNSATLYWLGQPNPTYTIQYWPQGTSDTTILPGLTYDPAGYELLNLDAVTTYEWTVSAICSDGTVYTGEVKTFTTPSNATQLPYFQSFDEVDLEDITEFTFMGTGINQWAIGSATGHEGNSMYISDDGGVSCHYGGNQASNAYAVLNISFPEGSYEYHLSFDYKVRGEVTFDLFSVYLADESENIIENADPPGSPLLYNAYAHPEWTHVDYTLQNVAGTSQKIIFYWKNDFIVFNDPPAAVDNISIDYYTCPQPSYLSVSNVTDDGARLSWIENGNATSWIVYYKPKYSNEPYSEIYEANTTSTTLMDLFSNTEYECYVQAVCTEGTLSSPSGVFTFKTECGSEGISVLPFMENFENYVNVNGSDYVPCWMRLNSDPAHYVYVNRMDFETNCLDFHYTPNCYTMAVLPGLSSNIPVSTLMVSFDARRQSFYGGPLEFGVLSDPTLPSSFEVIDTVSFNYTNNWEHINIFCDNYTGSGNYLAFRVFNAGNNSVALDNLVVDILPDCLPATNLTASAITTNSALVAWNGNGTDYDVYLYSTTDTIYYNTRDPYILLSNLQPSSNYSVMVQTVCYGDYAEMSLPMTFSTACGPITLTPSNPWVESFENYLGTTETAISFSPCWSRLYTFLATNGVFPSVYNYAPAAHSGNKVVEFKGNENMLVFPQFSNSINTLRLSMWANTSGASPQQIGVMEVGVVTPDSTFIPVDTVVFTAYSLHGWDSEHADFMGPYDFNVIEDPQADMRIAIRYKAANGDFSCYLDDFTVSLIPDCASPVKTSLRVNNIGTTQADVSWEDRDASHLAWTVYYKPSDGGDDAWLTTESSVTTATLYNLDPNTTYDVYVVTKCGSPGEDATLMAHFTTQLVPVTLPFATQFTNPSEWNLDNGLCTSRWMIGTLDGTTNGLFVTEDGVNPGYADGSSSVVSASKILDLGNYSQVKVEFDVQAGGEITQGVDFDYMKLFLAPMTDKFEPYHLLVNQPVWSNANYSTNAFDFSSVVGQTNGTSLPYKISLTNGNTLHAESVMLNPNANLNETTLANLVFVWKNDHSGRVQPGAIVTNLNIEPILCPQPTNLAAINVGASSAEIVWTPGQYETSWVLAYKTDIASTWTEVTVDTNEYLLSGLQPLTDYQVRVMSDCGGGQTSLYSNVTFKTNNCDVEDQCSYTLNMQDTYGDGWNNAYLEIKQNNSTIATFTVSAAQGASASETFTLCHGLPTALYWHSGQYDGECSFTLIGPEGDVLYTGNPYYQSPTVAMFSFTTDCPNALPCSTPVGLSALSVTNNSAQVTWNTGTATAWKLQYKNAAAPDWNPEIALTNNFYTLTGLAEATQYLFRVMAVCSDSTQSAWSQPAPFTTASSSTPVEPTVVTYAATNVTSTSAVLNGAITDQGNQTILSRGFEWKLTEGGTYTQEQATGSMMSYALAGLTPNTSYTYRAFATTANTTTYGALKTFTTEQLLCQTPTNLTQLGVTNSSMTLVWTNYAETNEWEIRYRIGTGEWTTVSVNTTYYVLTDLLPTTTYELQVRAICVDDNVSGWSSSLFVTTTGIEQYLQNQIILSPNPADDHINVQCTMHNAQLEGATIELLDMYGKLLQTIEVTSEITQIDIRHLSAGVYFARVNTQEGAVTKKFVKE